MKAVFFHKGEKVCLSKNYQDEDCCFKAGEQGTVRRYDGFLVVVNMEHHYTISVHPQWLRLLPEN